MYYANNDLNSTAIKRYFIDLLLTILDIYKSIFKGALIGWAVTNVGMHGIGKSDIITQAVVANRAVNIIHKIQRGIK